MPRERKSPTLGTGTLLARPIQIDAVERKVRSAVETDVKRKLGLRGAIPSDLQGAIDVASKAAAQQSVELAVTVAAEESARAVSRADTFARFSDKVRFAVDGIKVIDDSNEVTEVLKKRASLLAKKKKALVDAGFSDEEAMDILLADIAARGS
jgi:hypothetical protein